jgi:hypothetical protein
MATSLSLENDPSLAQGYIKVNGSTAATLTTSGITGNLTGNVTGNLTGLLTAGGSLTLATAQTASGTSVNFTGIPSWVKRITVMFNGVSTNSTSAILMQLGDAGGVESTAYSSDGGLIGASNFASATSYTTGFGLFTPNQNVNTYNGLFTFSQLSTNLWVMAGTYSLAGSANVGIAAGKKTLSDTLTQFRITTVNGTDTFDAGTINISFEG